MKRSLIHRAARHEHTIPAIQTTKEDMHERTVAADRFTEQGQTTGSANAAPQERDTMRTRAAAPAKGGRTHMHP